VTRLKSDGHIHRLCWNATTGELYTAGHQKLEIWALSQDAGEEL
jgi:hypothetical protein